MSQDFTVIIKVWVCLHSCSRCMEDPFDRKTRSLHFEKFHHFFDHFLLFIFCVLIFLGLLFSLIFLPNFLKISSIISPNSSIDFVFNFCCHIFNFWLPFLAVWWFLFKHPISWMYCLLIPLRILMMACLFVSFGFSFSFLNPTLVLFPLSSFLSVTCFGLCLACWKLFCKVWWSLDSAYI